jgi:hypothetical protein
MPDDTFKEFMLDQLGALPELRARAMVERKAAIRRSMIFAIKILDAASGICLHTPVIKGTVGKPIFSR